MLGLKKSGKDPGFSFVSKKFMMLPIVAFLATVAFAAPSVTASTTAVMGPLAETSILANTPQSLEDYVREYFKDDPVLAEVARCESTFRHLKKDGSIVRGKVNDRDIGVMQINTDYHEVTAEKLGFDLETLEGNLAYAKYLYEKEGTTPWLSSSPCWGKENHVPKVLAKK